MKKLYNNISHFALGEISTEGLVRIGYENKDKGALVCNNMQILQTGGIKRRRGLKHIANLEDNAKLIPFYYDDENKYMLVFGEKNIKIFKNDIFIQKVSGVFYTLDDLNHIQWAMKDGELFITHEKYPIAKLSRITDNNWSFGFCTFPKSEDGKTCQPFAKFKESNNSVFSIEKELDEKNKNTGFAFVKSTKPIFNSNFENINIRISDGEFIIRQIISDKEVKVSISKDLSDYSMPYKDLFEQAFSSLRGYPKAITFYQNRMVLAGSKSLKSRIWLSQTDDYFNFDLGQGFDNQAIEFDIISQRNQIIQTLFSGQHLQVFTNSSEWIITALPITPTNIRLIKQTELGSVSRRYISPKLVEGSTIFITRNEKEVASFFFGEINEKYESEDLSILSNHLIYSPKELEYNQKERILYLLKEDGCLSSLTLNKRYAVQAWGNISTQGDFISIANLDGQVYVVVNRAGQPYLEKFQNNVYVDNCRFLELDEATDRIDFFKYENMQGLYELSGKKIFAILDGEIFQDIQINQDFIELPKKAKKIKIGIAYTHTFAPNPQGLFARNIRGLEVSFRLNNTKNLNIDVGFGLQNVSLKKYCNNENFFTDISKGYTGDIRVRLASWRKSGLNPLWKIQDDFPANFKIVSVNTILQYN